MGLCESDRHGIGRGPKYGFLSENDGLVAVRQHAVFEVIAQAAREDGFFDVLAVAHHVVDRVGVVDADDVLLDDRSLVEFARHVVTGRADQLDAALVSLVVGLAPTKLGRKEWWMLMIWPG